MSENLNEILEIDKDPKQTSTGKKSLGEILFSFEGRICRTEYWTKAFPILFIYSVIVNVIMLLEIEETGAPGPISIILSIISLWPALAVIIKRLHDRNRSGWFLLTILIPIANAIFGIWIIIEVWFLKGTEGENRFGPDPLATL